MDRLRNERGYFEPRQRAETIGAESSTTGMEQFAPLCDTTAANSLVDIRHGGSGGKTGGRRTTQNTLECVRQKRREHKNHANIVKGILAIIMVFVCMFLFYSIIILLQREQAGDMEDSHLHHSAPAANVTTAT